MSKTTHVFQTASDVSPSGIEVQFDDGAKLTIGNSGAGGISVHEKMLVVIPKLIWRCDNASLLEKLFPVLSGDFIGRPLEVIVDDVVERFSTRNEFILFLENFKV
jgi:hypothetical protein